MNDSGTSIGTTLGARFVKLNQVDPADLGALAPLVGTWKNLPLPDDVISAGWNVISVPGQDAGFVFEVIPYSETLVFSPVIVQAGNRGPVIDGQQVEQSIFGLVYEQKIESVCTTDFCRERGFPSGSTIHVETGLLLNLGEPNGGYSIARLSTIPHGNSLLALGSPSVLDNPKTNFFQKASAVPTLLNGSSMGKLGYADPIVGPPQFSVFEQSDPNTFLKKTLDGLVSSATLTEVTAIQMSTNTPDADGGILNIPFIQTNVNATKMDATFWIEHFKGGRFEQVLQYSQTINLVFPATGSSQPVIWPHITINSLVKVQR